MTDIGRSVRRPTFWFASAAAFIVAAAYPVALAIQCESREAERWMQNDVAFTVYVLWLFPLVVGLLVTSIFPGIRRHLAASNRRILDAIAFVLVLAALVVVVTDVGRVDTDQLPVAAEPALLRGRDAMQFDAAVRLPLRKAYAALLDTRFVNDEAKNRAWIAWDGQRMHAVALYRQKYPGFRSVADVFRRGSATAYIKVLLNAMVGVVLALIFTALVGGVMIVVRAPTTPLNTEALLVGYSLACLWFPMRLYSEWYDGYYSLGRLRSYPAFWVLVLAALLALALLIYLLKPSRVAVTIPSMAAAFGIVFTAIGALKPAVLWYLGAVVETFNVAILFVVALILVTPLAAVAVAAAARDNTASEDTSEPAPNGPATISTPRPSGE